MATTSELQPPKVRWDLSALFESIEDPGIEQAWSNAMAQADSFDTTYRGKIDDPNLTAQTLAQSLKDMEALANGVAKPMGYSQLLFATDTGDPKYGAFMQKQRERGTELSVKLMFFELELQAAPAEIIDRLLKDNALENYVHYVQAVRAYSPFRLSEPEEIILEETANTGSRAWVRLFEEVTANHIYKLKRPGSETTEVLNQQELLALLREPSRDLRKAAADCLSDGLKEIERVVVFTYNNVVQDKAVEDRLRGMEYAEQSRHIANELDKETVDLVVRKCHENYGLVSRFYNVKRQILGLPELTHIDRYAPLFESEEPVDWARAKQIVLDAFGDFSPVVEAKAQEFFDQNWIDAEPRKGKQGGAFCSYNTPDTHPVIFQSYLNRLDDVMTLAHELGHGVHASLSREQSYFNFHGTLPLAELASTFGEMLVFDSLVREASLKDRLALYADKIEGVFATVFRQAAMFTFEQRAHVARRTEGELSSERLCEIWHEEMQRMFGQSLTMGEQQRTWWTYVGHFFFAPFYVYAYSFGELLVLSLYQMAKEEGPSFADKYVDLLRLGGSRFPQDLMATVNVDLKDPKFWDGGFRAMELLVSEFEKLWAEYSA